LPSRRRRGDRLRADRRDPQMREPTAWTAAGFYLAQLARMYAIRFGQPRSRGVSATVSRASMHDGGPGSRVLPHPEGPTTPMPRSPAADRGGNDARGLGRPRAGGRSVFVAIGAALDGVIRTGGCEMRGRSGNLRVRLGASVLGSCLDRGDHPLPFPWLAQPRSTSPLASGEATQTQIHAAPPPAPGG